jgi:hypothetical protein
MENKKIPTGEEINPVSRKTNEEIDSDDQGSLIIGGENTDDSKSLASDGPFSEDVPKGKNSLTDQDEHTQD